MPNQAYFYANIWFCTHTFPAGKVFEIFEHLRYTMYFFFSLVNIENNGHVLDYSG